MKRQIDCMDGGVTALDIESMARYWSQDAENYGNIIQDELASFRVEAWQKLLREKMPADTSRVLDLGCGQGNAYCCLMPIGICPCLMRIWPGGQKTGGRNVCVSMAMLWRLLMSLLSLRPIAAAPERYKASILGRGTVSQHGLWRSTRRI